MAERPLLLSGGNLPLALATGLLWAAVLAVFVGPARIALVEAREDRNEKLERFADWMSQGGTKVSAQDRTRWTAEYERLAELVVPASDEAAMLGRVANLVAAPSVSALEVVRGEARRDASGELLAFAVRDPFGADEAALTPRAVRVRFRSDYTDLRRILPRFAAGESALRIERLDLRRHYPDLQVELDLTLWMREGDPS